MNKYVIVFITFFLGYFVVNSIYKEINRDKTPGKAKRLSCQKKVTSFERGFSNPEITYVQKLIEHGNTKFTSYVEKAVYSESVLFDYITLVQTDEIFKNNLEKYVKYNENNDESFSLQYYIYENDKNDPGKKTKKSKSYAGYTVFEVKNKNNKTIYKVQIDFMDNKGKDIKNSIQCAVKSFMTFNKQ